MAREGSSEDSTPVRLPAAHVPRQQRESAQCSEPRADRDEVEPVDEREDRATACEGVAGEAHPAQGGRGRAQHAKQQSGVQVTGGTTPTSRFVEGEEPRGRQEKGRERPQQRHAHGDGKGCPTERGGEVEGHSLVAWMRVRSGTNRAGGEGEEDREREEGPECQDGNRAPWPCAAAERHVPLSASRGREGRPRRREPEKRGPEEDEQEDQDRPARRDGRRLDGRRRAGGGANRPGLRPGGIEQEGVLAARHVPIGCRGDAVAHGVDARLESGDLGGCRRRRGVDPKRAGSEDRAAVGSQQRQRRVGGIDRFGEGQHELPWRRGDARVGGGNGADQLRVAQRHAGHGDQQGGNLSCDQQVAQSERGLSPPRRTRHRRSARASGGA